MMIGGAGRRSRSAGGRMAYGIKRGTRSDVTLGEDVATLQQCILGPMRMALIVRYLICPRRRPKASCWLAVFEPCCKS